MPDFPNLPKVIISPARSSDMQQRLPKVFHPGLDDAATRLVMQRLIDADAPTLGPINTTRALGKPSERAYRQLCNDWFTFCQVSEAQMIGLDHATRCALVELWMADRSAQYAPSSFRTLRKAVHWWANTHGLENPVTPLSSYLRGTKPGRGQSIPLTPEQLLELLEGLRNGEVLQPGPRARPEFVEGWHLRMLAGTTITITASLRAVSELTQQVADTLSDGNVVGVSSQGLLVRIGRTKNKQPRDILLRPRPDLLCPLSALQGWLEWCRRLGLHRPGGLLLPSVSVYRLREPLGTSKSFDRSQWSVATRYLEAKGHDMTNRTLHGCRALMPTAAAANGCDLHTLRDLGNWARIDSAMTYVREYENDEITSRLTGGESR
jgi:hypothetical protein